MYHNWFSLFFVLIPKSLSDRLISLPKILIQMKNLSFAFTLIIIILLSCQSEKQNSSKTDECAMGKPVPMFSDTMQLVERHQFSLKGQIGSEFAVLKKGLMVEIIQSGCDKVSQEFRFTRPGDFRKMDDAFWIKGAYSTFGFLSDASPALGGMRNWAELIARAEDAVKIGQPFNPDPGVEIVIDKIANDKEAIIIVKMEQL